MDKTHNSKRAVNGVLLLNKHSGLSSNQILQNVKRIFKAKKAGHTGSLDPLATGMLPICFGEATKFSHFLLDANKTYEVTAKLGTQTSTGDKEGEIIKEAQVPFFSQADLENILNSFLGESMQVPPMYSALKFKGQPLYKLARQGQQVERKPRQITIYNIALINYTSESITIKVNCSKGTYIRSLIEDIASKLNTFAHVSSLHRTAVSPFQSESMHTIEYIKSLDNPDNLLLPLDAGLQDLAKLILQDEQRKHMAMGQSIEYSDLITNRIYRIYSSDEVFLGLAEASTHSQLKPKRLIVTDMSRS